MKEGVFSISQIPIDINFFFKQVAGLIGLSIQGMEYWQCERGNKKSDLQQAQSQSSTGNELSSHCEVCSIEEACILLMAWEWNSLVLSRHNNCELKAPVPLFVVHCYIESVPASYLTAPSSLNVCWRNLYKEPQGLVSVSYKVPHCNTDSITWLTICSLFKTNLALHHMLPLLYAHMNAWEGFLSLNGTLLAFGGLSISHSPGC